MGLFAWILQRARLGELSTEEANRQPGDFVEPGSIPEAAAMPPGSMGSAAGLEQLRGLHASGVIDTATFSLIEATMKDPTAQLDQLHASGMMSDEVYAQAMESMPATTDPAEAAERELLQNGESATAAVLTVEQATDGTATQLLTLEVHPLSGDPYTASCAVAAGRLRAEPKAGDFFRVKVDPNDPKRVAVDWPGIGS